MALRCTASASKRPEEVRKPQQVLAARFKLCGRKPLRGLPPSPRWTWRCALREANVRKGLGGYTRSSGTYLGPSGCANAPRGFVLFAPAVGCLVGPCSPWERVKWPWGLKLQLVEVINCCVGNLGEAFL